MDNQLQLDLLPDLPQTDLLHELAPALWQRPDVFAIWLEGSMGRDDADAYSDVDLYIGVEPELMATWKALDVPALFGEQYAAHRFSDLADDFCIYHIFLTAGRTYDLHVQTRHRTLPNVTRLILGCRDENFEAELAAGKDDPAVAAQPVDPAVIHNLLVAYWMNADKTRKLLYRNQDFIVQSGLHIFRHILLRLIHMDYAGTDCGDLTRSMLHQFKAADRVLQQALGEDLRTVMGASTATRQALCQVQESISDDIGRVGRSLAVKYGFDYPDALEQAVRQNWRAFKGRELAG